MQLSIERAADLDRLAPGSGDRQTKLKRLELAVVEHSLNNLMTFPSIRRRVEKGELELHGNTDATGSIASLDQYRVGSYNLDGSRAKDENLMRNISSKGGGPCSDSTAQIGSTPKRGRWAWM